MRRFDNGFVLEDLAMGQPDGKLAKAGNKVSHHQHCLACRRGLVHALSRTTPHVHYISSIHSRPLLPSPFVEEQYALSLMQPQRVYVFLFTSAVCSTRRNGLECAIAYTWPWSS